MANGEHIVVFRHRLARAVTRWEERGILSQPQAAQLHSEVAVITDDSWLFHFAAHLLLSLALRFPLGSGARFLWTSSFRVRAWRKRREDREGYARAKRVHTVAVFLVGALPGIGGAAYLCTREAWNSPLLLNLVLVDATLWGMPSRAYVFLWHIARQYLLYARYVLPQ